MNDEEWGWLRHIHTEEEWHHCDSPQPLLTYVGTTASNRKFRLIAAACARRIWSHLPDASRQSVEVAEHLADGQAGEAERVAAEEAADAVVDAVIENATDENEGGDTAYYATLSAAWCARSFSRDAPEESGHAAFYAAATEGTKEPFVALLRCVFGNPFRPSSIEPAWHTPTVKNLATAAYEERSLPSGELDTTRLAVLADALEEAGCDSVDILNHLRGRGPHVRGCWVLDLILAKE